MFVPEDKLKMHFKLKASKEQGKGKNAGNSEGSQKYCKSKSGNEAEKTGEKLTLLEGSPSQQSNVHLLEWKKKGRLSLKMEFCNKPGFMLSNLSWNIFFDKILSF